LRRRFSSWVSSRGMENLVDRLSPTGLLATRTRKEPAFALSRRRSKFRYVLGAILALLHSPLSHSVE
jgi:hypothetical protein